MANFGNGSRWDGSMRLMLSKSNGCSDGETGWEVWRKIGAPGAGKVPDFLEFFSKSLNQDEHGTCCGILGKKGFASLPRR